MNNASRPIGIFDSGIGGLTVARAIQNRMPEENIVYFGDTAHLPYGDKSPATLRARAHQITDMLLREHCKLILIACNSAASAVGDTVRALTRNQIPVIDVINPVIQALARTHRNQKIGLIGTRQTIRSGIYTKKLATLAPDITLACKATGLLASAIEEFGASPVTDRILREYLADPIFDGIQSLLPACTHYPIIRDNISAFFNKSVYIIDPADIVAKAVQNQLLTDGLLHIENTGKMRFYVSDITDSFVNGARFFFGNTITLEHRSVETAHTLLKIPADAVL